MFCIEVVALCARVLCVCVECCLGFNECKILCALNGRREWVVEGAKWHLNDRTAHSERLHFSNCGIEFAVMAFSYFATIEIRKTFVMCVCVFFGCVVNVGACK